MINENSRNSNDDDKTTSKLFIIDAKNAVLGRLSSFLAVRLMGKHKVSYLDNKICGDRIVVINARQIILTGKKLNKKKI